VGAVEAATTGRHRPKFSRFPGHDFLTAYAARLDVNTGELITSEIAAFITANALVTVRKDEQFPVADLLARWDNNADINQYNIGALVHGRRCARS
jgi:magnesium transporter